MDNIRDLLLKAVKYAVSTFGVSGVSTRNIADIANVSDANIYRFFKSRDELLYEAYADSSRSMVSMVKRDIDQLKDNPMGLSTRDCARIVFMKVWKFLLDDPSLCKFHAYYYNSFSFEKYALGFHKNQVESLVDHVKWMFKSDNAAIRYVNNVVPLMFDCAIRVADGRLPDNNDTANDIFEDMYDMLNIFSNRYQGQDEK